MPREHHSRISAKIFSFQNGLEEYENVELIRLKSKNSSFLIMEDHLPMIGEVEGSVEILFDGQQALFEDIKGYYMHKKNVFELILKE